VKKVAVGQAAGSALMRDDGCGGGDPGGDGQGSGLVPVTLKMRNGWDHATT